MKTLSIFLLSRCWPEGKHSDLSTSLSLTLLLDSVLIILVPNQMLSLDSGMSIVIIEDDRLGFYFILFYFPFIFSYFLLKSRKQRR